MIGTRFTFVVLGLAVMSGCSPWTRPVPVESEPEPVVSAAPAHSTQGAIFSSANRLTLFDDPKASQPGDVLTVLLVERMDASKSASTSTSKETTIAQTNPTIFGLPVTHNGVGILGASGESTNAFSGQGASTQSNRLAGSVTVVIEERLPNGNLRISGRKRIELNQGSEVISIAGIVRPRDINPDNTINSDRIAQSEIRYRGKGDINDANRMGPIARFFNAPLFLLDRLLP